MFSRPGMPIAQVNSYVFCCMRIFRFASRFPTPPMPKRLLLFKGGWRWILGRMDAVATANLPQSLFRKREVLRYPRHGQFHVVLQQTANVGTVVTCSPRLNYWRGFPREGTAKGAPNGDLRHRARKRNGAQRPRFFSKHLQAGRCVWRSPAIDFRNGDRNPGSRLPLRSSNKRA